MSVTQVTPISLGLVNVFLLRGTRTVLVDTGNTGTAQRVLAGIAEAGVDPKDISLILITHGHNDHFGNAAEIKKATGAPIAAQKADVPAISEGKNPPLNPTSGKARLMAKIAGMGKVSTAPAVPVDVVIDTELDLAPYGVEGKVISTPGHTPGSVSVILASGDAVVGDLVIGTPFSRRKPMTPYFVDDQKVLNESMRRVGKLKPKTIYCGHGGPLTVEALRKSFPWIGF